MNRNNAINELNRVIEGLRLLSPEADVILTVAYQVKMEFTTARLFLDRMIVGAEELRPGEEVCFKYKIRGFPELAVGQVIRQNPQSSSVTIDSYDRGYHYTYYYSDISEIELIAQE